LTLCRGEVAGCDPRFDNDFELNFSFFGNFSEFSIFRFFSVFSYFGVFSEFSIFRFFSEFSNFGIFSEFSIFRFFSEFSNFGIFSEFSIFCIFSEVWVESLSLDRLLWNDDDVDSDFSFFRIFFSDFPENSGILLFRGEGGFSDDNFLLRGESKLDCFSNFLLGLETVAARRGNSSLGCTLSSE